MLNLCGDALWNEFSLVYSKTVFIFSTYNLERLEPWYIQLCALFIFLCNLLDVSVISVVSEWLLCLSIVVRINSVLLRHSTEYFTTIFPRAASGGKWETEKEVSYQALGKMFWGWYNHTSAFTDHNYWNGTGAILPVSNLRKTLLGGALC